jgi:methionyl-tRNA formyltransferase
MAFMDTRILFMGTPDFAVPSLNALHNTYGFIGAVTQPDRRSGRGRTLSYSPVKQAALELGVPVLQPAALTDPAVHSALSDLNPGLIVVAAYGQILPDSLLALPEHGCLNVHASLLPRWRGASPINAAVLHGDRETGVTIMKMDSGLDTGPILTQRSTPISREDTAGTVFGRLAVMGAELLIETIAPYLSGEIQPQPQDDARATYAPLLSRKDGELDFQAGAEELERQIRAFHPWPGSFTFVDGQRLIIHQAQAQPETSPGAGVLINYEGRPAVGTGEGILILEKVQPAGKRTMSGSAYLHGSQSWTASKIGRSNQD